MTNLLVVSDTHGNYKRLDTVLNKQIALEDKFRPRHLIHLGDGIEDIEKCKLAEKFCVYSVRGNCDSFFYSEAVPKERIIELEGCKILIMHGHTYGVKMGIASAAAYAAECGADILMYGHTHAPVSYTLEKGKAVENVVLEKPLIVFNPGSLGYEGSFGEVSILDNKISCSHGTIGNR